MRFKLIDYARLRNYDIRELLCHELTSTSFFLMQDGYLRKPAKSEFSREIENKLAAPPPSEVPVLGKRIKAAIVIDFMAYACRVPVKKLKLKHTRICLTTYGRHSVICQGIAVTLI